MTLSVTPNPLTSGGEAEVCIDGGPASSTITVEIDDGADPPQTDTLDIDTDENGDGCATWQVPTWDWANFNHGDCPEVSRRIVRPPA